MLAVKQVLWLAAFLVLELVYYSFYWNLRFTAFFIFVGFFPRHVNAKDNFKGNFYFAFIFHFIVVQTLWECLEYS